MRLIYFAATVLAFSTAALAQSPYSGMQSRPIKALSEQQIADLRAGRGMGLALPAELNGYPGPVHVLELADKLGELAALAVQPAFRREGYGEALLREIEARARKLKLSELFVLTTKTAHWFLERGFRVAQVADLPRQKQALYNYQRKSLVYRKAI